MKKLILIVLLGLTTVWALRAQGLAIEKYASGANDKQWALLNIYPPNAIVTLDSTDVRMTRNGVVQAFLPLGEHSFVVESPFYRPYTSKFELNDSLKVELDIRLEPAFGFLSVATPLRNGLIFIDGRFVGKGTSPVSKYEEGSVHIVILRDSLKYYDGTYFVDSGSKNKIVISDFTPTHLSRAEAQAIRYAEAGLNGVSLDATAGSDENENQWGMVNLHSNVAGATVLVNGIEYGESPCVIKGLKPNVKYRITLRKDGWREKTLMISVKSGEMPDIGIKMKKK